uniref:Uncharacterized protein n=1 Tax=Rhizophora mucronata TaxID=61149 RepID=A0A2P2JUZ2_RHIMU
MQRNALSSIQLFRRVIQGKVPFNF